MNAFEPERPQQKNNSQHTGGFYTILGAVIGGMLAFYATLVGTGKQPWPPWRHDPQPIKLYYKYTRLHNRNKDPVEFQYFDGVAWRVERIAPGDYLNLEVNDESDEISIRYNINQHNRALPPAIKKSSPTAIVMDTPISGSAKEMVPLNRFCDFEPLQLCDYEEEGMVYAYVEVYNLTKKTIKFEYLESFPEKWSPFEIAPKTAQAFSQTSPNLFSVAIRFDANQLKRNAPVLIRSYETIAATRTGAPLTFAEKKTARKAYFKTLSNGEVELFQ